MLFTWPPSKVVRGCSDVRARQLSLPTTELPLRAHFQNPPFFSSIRFDSSGHPAVCNQRERLESTCYGDNSSWYQMVQRTGPRWAYGKSHNSSSLIVARSKRNDVDTGLGEFFFVAGVTNDSTRWRPTAKPRRRPRRCSRSKGTGLEKKTTASRTLKATAHPTKMKSSGK